MNHLGILLRLFPFVQVIEHLHILKVVTFDAFVGDPPSSLAIDRPLAIGTPTLGFSWNLIVGKDYLVELGRQLVRNWKHRVDWLQVARFRH